MATKRKEYQGLDKYTWIRRSRRTYRNNKIKFFSYVFGFLFLLFLVFITYKRIEYNHMVEQFYSNQQLAQNGQSGQSGPNNSAPKNYTSIYDFKAEPLVLRQPSKESIELNKAAPAPALKLIEPITQKADKFYPVEPPLIDNLKLGQTITEAELHQKQYKTNVKLTPDSFMVEKENLRYKLYEQDGAKLFLEIHNNRLIKMSFNFENVNTRALTQKVLKAHSVELENIHCMATKVLDENKLKNDKTQEFVNTDICQTQAKGQVYTLQVISLVALNKTMVSFEIK